VAADPAGAAGAAAAESPGPAVPAARTEQPAGQPARPAGPASPADAVDGGAGVGSTDTAGPAGPEQSASPAGAAGPGGPGRAVSARATDPAVAPHQPTGAASTAAEPADAAGTACADQPRGPAVTAVLASRAGPARATVADQPTAGCAVLPRTRSRVDAVTDQRTPGEGQAGRIDRGSQNLPNRLSRIGAERRKIGGLRADIRLRTRAQVLHELVMERRRLRTEHLKALAVGGEQRRNGRRYLILGRGQYPCGPGSRGRVGRTQPHTQTG